MGSKAHILVVDDEEMICELVKAVLARRGYRVTAFSKPSDALAYYREAFTSVQLVILDMAMPGMTGWALFTAMKEIHPGIKAIISSGFGADEVVQKALDDGVLGFLQKPYDMKQFVNIIENATETSP